MLPDELKPTTVGFLTRAFGWFFEQGITCCRERSDNRSAYSSRGWRKACRALDLKPIRTKPTTPLNNGQAERFLSPQAIAQHWTLRAKWAYVIANSTSDVRNRWLSVSRASLTATGAHGYRWSQHSAVHQAADDQGMTLDVLNQHGEG